MSQTKIFPYFPTNPFSYFFQAKEGVLFVFVCAYVCVCVCICVQISVNVCKEVPECGYKINAKKILEIKLYSILSH